MQEAAVARSARTGVTVAFGIGLLALGVAMLVRQDLQVPFWSPVTGVILAVTALIPLTTTYLTVRAAEGEDTTHTGEACRHGSVRLQV